MNRKDNQIYDVSAELAREFGAGIKTKNGCDMNHNRLMRRGQDSNLR